MHVLVKNCRNSIYKFSLYKITKLPTHYSTLIFFTLLDPGPTRYLHLYVTVIKRTKNGLTCDLPHRLSETEFNLRPYRSHMKFSQLHRTWKRNSGLASRITVVTLRIRSCCTTWRTGSWLRSTSGQTFWLIPDMMDTNSASTSIQME